MSSQQLLLAGNDAAAAAAFISACAGVRRRKTKWPCSTHGTHFKKERKAFAQTEQRDGGEQRQVCVRERESERELEVKTAKDGESSHFLSVSLEDTKRLSKRGKVPFMFLSLDGAQTEGKGGGLGGGS